MVLDIGAHTVPVAPSGPRLGATNLPQDEKQRSTQSPQNPQHPYSQESNTQLSFHRQYRQIALCGFSL